MHGRCARQLAIVIIEILSCNSGMPYGLHGVTPVAGILFLYEEKKMLMSNSRMVLIVAVGAVCLSLGLSGIHTANAQGSAPTAAPAAPPPPWMDKSLDADKRADLMIDEMTLDEKIQLVHGAGWG